MDFAGDMVLPTHLDAAVFSPPTSPVKTPWSLEMMHHANDLQAALRRVNRYVFPEFTDLKWHC